MSATSPSWESILNTTCETCSLDLIRKPRCDCAPGLFLWSCHVVRIFLYVIITKKLVGERICDKIEVWNLLRIQKSQSCRL